MEHFEQQIGNRRYKTEGALLLANNEIVPDGDKGIQTFLYRTPRNNYFTLEERREWLTVVVGGGRWGDSVTRSIIPMTEEKAASLWPVLPVRSMSFDAAFPEMALQDA